jgi:hypothetical protein
MTKDLENGRVHIVRGPAKTPDVSDTVAPQENEPQSEGSQENPLGVQVVPLADGESSVNPNDQ